MRFSLSDQPLGLPPVHLPGAGAFVTFEGRIRDHADGRSVLTLEYEAYPEMAEHQGEMLVQEAIDRFGLVDARVVHRVGALTVGDVAVLAQAASPHRREAFEACEWLMDQLKWRVPIWKRETYADGVSEWVGAGAPPAPDDGDRMFARQVVLPEIGPKGQERLGQARVLVVGAGGLAAGAVPALVGAGVGTLGIVDPDTVEETNLHRQVLFTASDIGRQKAERVVAFAKRLRPSVQAHAFPHRLSRENAARLVADYDWVLDCTDSLDTKFLLDEACRGAGKTLVTSSIHQFEGQVLVVSPGGPCLRCLFPERPPEECVGTCEQSGVLGVTPLTFGALQANETIKGILGMPVLDQDLLLFDLRTLESVRLHRRPNPDCEGCGRGVASPGQGLVVDRLPAGHTLVDIRDPDEEPRLTVDHLAVPMEDCYQMDWDGPTVFVCASGRRSYRLVADLRARGVHQVYSLQGGVGNASARKA
ncbi:MAG: ThiF family adenylyltransferase [Fimbriimonadaceae bacterium]|nr:ThiF family adenylyltransferase [Fimbriimonadaceae bacterium]